MIEFGKVTGRLKGLDRAGWVMHRVPKPESVAEHMYRTTLLAMLFAKEMNVDQLKAMKMALIHDVGEAIIGDIVTDRGTRVNEALLKKKMVKERNAIRRIFSLVDGKEFVNLFEEMEAGKTPAARLVKQLDKLEMVLQAYEYEHKYAIDLEEFYQTGFVRIKNKKVRKILEDLYSSRPKKITKKHAR